MSKLTTSSTISNLLASQNQTQAQQAMGIYGAALPGTLVKTERLTPAFEVVSGAIKTSQIIAVCLPSGVMAHIPSATSAPLDTGAFAAGADYAIHATSDGSLASSASFTPPAGGVLIGGFHYAPCGNGAIVPASFFGTTPQGTGGALTPQINPYSIWDQNFRPACPDPRGMALVDRSWWCDIYLTNENPDLYGTSSYDKPIADDSTRAIIPSFLGGNGTARFANHDWFTSANIASAYGKKLLDWDNFISATLGAVQGIAAVNDPGNTNLIVNGASSGSLTSMFGIIQSFGALWIWVTDAGNDNDKKALTGGFWYDSGFAGSRYVLWYVAATHSGIYVGSRFRSDHLIA